MAPKRNRLRNGFTLLELLVALAVVALLSTMAFPSFARIIEANRVVSATNEFKTALNYARSEAVRRNRSVTLSPLSGDWNNGWEVRTQNASLRQWPADPKQLNVVFGTSKERKTIGRLRLSSLGRLLEAGDGNPETTFISFAVDKDRDEERCIRLEPSGLSRVQDVHSCPFWNGSEASQT